MSSFSTKGSLVRTRATTFRGENRHPLQVAEPGESPVMMLSSRGFGHGNGGEVDDAPLAKYGTRRERARISSD